MNDSKPRYFLCVRNEGHAASLQVRTVYVGLGDREAAAHAFVGAA